MKYFLTITLLLLLSGCTNHHRVVLIYESGDAAAQGGSEIKIKTQGETHETN